MRMFFRAACACALAAAVSPRASADFVLFDTGAPDGKMAMASQPAGPGGPEIEAADDFLTTGTTTITSATFTGLLVGSVAQPTVNDVNVEIYRVFPNDSTSPPSGNVPSRNNSPADVQFDNRDLGAGQLTLSMIPLSSAFSAANSVLNGINKSLTPATGGEGAVRGQEVQFTVNFTTPFTLPAAHYFFVPQVQVTNGQFYWLSAAKPVTGQFAFAPDLQTWIRNDALQPDWLRVGTDIVGGSPAPQFNGAFSLSAVPEPSSVLLLALGLGGLLAARKRVKTP